MPNLHPADIVTWEAVYDDGFVMREARGARYGDIDRNRMRAFRLVRAGELLMELPCHDGRTGWHFFYRRRTRVLNGVRGVVFLMGFVPMGPLVLVDPAKHTYRTSDHFDDGEFYPPVPIPEEGEHFSFDLRGHSTDLRLKPQQIMLPSGYILRGNYG